MKRYAIVGIVLLAAVIRLPFWLEALRTPVDGDTAIIGLMAKHPLSSTTMWGQPYGSPIDAWLAAPFLVVFGRTGTALRIFYFVMGLLLVPLAARLARELDERAAIPAALLMACPSPYLLLLSALPPPFYPTILAFCALLLILTIRVGNRLDEGMPSALPLALWGALAGLCLWTHLMSAAVVATAGVFLLLRARPVLRLWPAVAGALATSAPVWWGAAFQGSEALRIVSFSGRQVTMLGHLRSLLPHLHRPLTGLLGTHVPWIPDDSYAIVFAPTGLAVLVIIIYSGLLALATRASRLRGPAGLLIATIVVVIAVFPFPLRANADAIRFLTPAYVPLVAVIAWSAAYWAGARPAVIALLTLSALHLTVAAQLLTQWRAADRAAHPFFLVDLAPIRQELDSHNIRHAYASYGVAYRLTFETNERIIASQPWNERFLHYPLPYLDEVRFAHGVAWILTPEPGDLPKASEFVDGLGAIGGTFKEAVIDNTRLFYAFVPPFGPTVTPLASAGLAGDGKLETWLTPPVDQPTTWALTPPRALDGITLMSGIGSPRLPRGFDLEVSADGISWERIVRRRRREERKDLRWVDGHPQYVIDDDVIATALGGRTVTAIRLTPVDADAWAAAEILLHYAQPMATKREWDEWLDPGLSWSERWMQLSCAGSASRADALYRCLLTTPHAR